MGKHGICPLSVAPLRQRIVCIPTTPPQCGLSPKETRPSCAAADCCYCACCSSPHRSVCCCFCCRSPSLSHRPKHDQPARDDDLPRPASVHCRHTGQCATRSAAHPTCPEFRGLPPLESKPQPPASFGCATGITTCTWARRAPAEARPHTRHLMPLTACASRAARLPTMATARAAAAAAASEALPALRCPRSSILRRSPRPCH
jgi:hypothetical protein